MVSGCPIALNKTGRERERGGEEGRDIGVELAAASDMGRCNATRERSASCGQSSRRGWCVWCEGEGEKRYPDQRRYVG